MTNQPIQPEQRLVIIDSLRGWALLGVVLMNYFDFFTLGKDWSTFKPDTFTNVVTYCLSYVFAAKSWTLLSLLFGYGFAMVMSSAAQKVRRVYLFFAGRMFWLLVLAFVNSALFFGDILKDYAFLGLLLLVFHRNTANTNFRISMLLLVILPFLAAYISSLGDQGWSNMSKLFPLYWSNDWGSVFWFGLKGTYLAQMISKPYLYTVHVLMFICMLWGHCLYRIQFFERLENKAIWIQNTCWISFAAILLLLGIDGFLQHYKIPISNYFNFRYLIVVATMVCVASILIWLHLVGKFKRFLNALVIIGKMTLTNYMMQNLIGLFIFSGVGFAVWNTQPIWFYVLTAIVVFTVQVYWSKWWLSRYRYGPVEWLWRTLSYGKILKLKKGV